MFARQVAVRLKPNSLVEFTSLMESEILAWLRKQEGFLGLITLVVPDSREVATISFWAHKANARGCVSSGYPEGLKILGNILDGTPQVKTFDVATSTFERGVRAGSRTENLIQKALGPPSYETSV
jgi:hypothetical protein